MKKRKNTRETKFMKQTALWLPHGMHKKLQDEGGKRGLGNEIRRRLQLSIDDEVLPREDPTTNDLLDQIKSILRYLSFEHPWHANQFAVDVVKSAINELLSDFKLSAEGAEPKSLEEFRANLRFGKGDTPESVGRIIARMIAADMYRKRGE